MIEISALGKDGRPIVGDLQGASPTGGAVTSESRPYRAMMPGDVIRDAAGWVVITDIRHNGIHGVTTFAAVDCAGDTIRHTRPGCTSGEVRTDTRVDVDTLWQLSSSRRAAESSRPAVAFRDVCPECGHSEPFPMIGHVCPDPAPAVFAPVVFDGVTVS